MIEADLRSHKRYIASTILALAGACAVPAWAAPSLCVKGETVFFSCPVRGGKIVSLCGYIAEGIDASHAGEWLQYRFGRPGAIELSYPEARQDSLSRFKGEHILIHMVNEVNLDSVSFVSGGIGYKVESSVLASGKLVEGVSIGDPQRFDLPRSGKARSSYPKAEISCSEQADTRKFYVLIEHLEK